MAHSRPFPREGTEGAASAAARERQPGWKQARQRASYESRPPITTVSPLNGAGRPSTRRCVYIAASPQPWQTAFSFAISSAIASSPGHRPERLAPVVEVEARDHDSHAAGDELFAHVDQRAGQELSLVDPDDVAARGELEDRLGLPDDTRRHPLALVADDLVDAVAVVDRRLDQDRRLARVAHSAQASHQLLALAAEHRAADQLELAVGTGAGGDLRRLPPPQPRRRALLAADGIRGLEGAHDRRFLQRLPTALL
jgi:hypothetical protein